MKLHDLQAKLAEVQISIAQTQLEHLQRLAALIEREATAKAEKAELERDNQAVINEHVKASIAANEMPKIKGLQS